MSETIEIPGRELLAFYRQCKAILPPAAAARTFAYIAEWQEAIDQATKSDSAVLVQELGVEHFCEYMNVDRRTVYRRNAEFRQVFPKCATPADLLAKIAA